MTPTALIEALTVLSQSTLRELNDDDLHRFEYLCFLWTDFARRELVMRASTGARLNMQHNAQPTGGQTT